MIKLQASPSLLPNNLLYDDLNNIFVYVHKNEIHFVFAKTITKYSRLQTYEKDDIFGLKICKLKSGKKILTVARKRGVQFINLETQTQLHYFDNGYENDQSIYSTGVSEFCTDKDFFVIGSSKGDLNIFSYSESHSDTIKLLTTIERAHKHAITDICKGQLANGEYFFACGDAIGGISCWNNKLYRISSSKHPKDKHPVTAIGALQNGRVVASFGTGHLRVFNAETGDLIYSIGAHARWITAMDVCPAMDFVITAAEDGYIFVWKIDKEVKLVSNYNVKNALFTGVKFNQSTNTIYATEYEGKGIHSVSISP